MTIVRLNGLTVQLNGMVILDTISATIEPGLTVIVGPNGAGKSSMLRCMAGLQVPFRGEVTLNARAVHGMAADSRAQQIAYLPQFPHCCWPLSVRRVVELGRFPHRRTRWLSAPQDDHLVTDVLQRLHLTHLQSRSVNSLSGGERQRVMLARALVADPHLLLLDEPVTGFDPAQQISLMEQLKEISGDGRIIVAIMHDLALARAFADRAIVMNHGHIAAMGAAEEVLVPELLAKVFGITHKRRSLYLPEMA